jgi:alkylated DNA repair dioxygenase AlkB
MDLFSSETSNLLPYDGTVNYYGKVIEEGASQTFFNSLLKKIIWKNDEAIIFGKHIITKRKVAWYGDSSFSYTYSKITKQALVWTPELLALKNLVEKISQTKFNSCLLNLYHNGDEAMSWHSDDEKALETNSAIASLSFGATRKFCFKHKLTKEKISIELESGSLLIMKDATQTNWMHSLPKSRKIKDARINLTFRTIASFKHLSEGLKSQ